MSILIESCNEYLYEGVVNSMPLCEADESGDKKSLWQKIKDFFKNIWNWIKDKVLALFGKKKKSVEDKLKELKELLKDSKVKSSSDYLDFIDSSTSTKNLDLVKATAKLLEHATEDEVEMVENKIEQIEEGIKNQDNYDFENITINNMKDIDLFEKLLEVKEKELSAIKKEIENVIKTNSIPEIGIDVFKKFGEAITNLTASNIRLLNITLLDHSIKAAKANKE